MASRRRLGAHIPSTELFDVAKERGADVVQIFLGDPQGWKKPEVLFDGGADALREAAEAADVQLYVHAPYILNVASTNNRIRIPSRKLLQQTVTLAGEIGALDGIDTGFCLDLCHAHAAGIPLGDGVKQILDATGRIDLVHVNDSKGEFGSGQDEHANIGDGTIGEDVIAAAVVESGAPGICETKPEGQAEDIAILRKALDAA